jgi:hypothetical protein
MGQEVRMPLIAIRIESTADLAEVVRVIRPLTGLGISRIKAALESGSAVFEGELFRNDHAEVVNTLRGLVRGLRGRGITFTIREDGSEIGPEVLSNILEGAERYRP